MAGEHATVPPLRRIVAKAIDLALILGATLALMQLSAFAVLLAGPLLLLSDALPGGSPGKRLFALKLAPRDEEQLRPLLASILRNLPLALPAPLVYLGPLGWLLLPVLVPALFGVEAALALLHPEGLRLGDRLAGTLVVEGDPEEEGAGDKYMTRPDL
jgi:uncharacterized RDD family membrane protein YckC